MGEATISSKALEEAMLKALPKAFPHLLGTDPNARVEFYDKVQRQATDHDRDFIKKYDDDLSTTLIFAGLFSAVASAFIVSVETSLQPDYTQLSYTVLTLMANISLGHTPAAFPQWTGPDPATVHVQAILYSSLAASLLAALIAMLGKQWLNRYSQDELRGSIIDRGRYRQRKINGMKNWRFDLVMECLPLMLQAALLLLGCALSKYLFTINKAVAGVAVGFTSFGVLFYLLIVSAATLSYNCPFQTPLSLVIRYMIRFDDEHREYLRRFRKWFGRTFFRRRRQQRPRSSVPHAIRGLNTFDVAVIGGQAELAMENLDLQYPLFNGKTDCQGFVLDSKCIAWMFKTSTDADVILAIMKFVPEVVWHHGIRAIPLDVLYDNVLECFSQSHGKPVVIPSLRNKAYLSAKALLHLVIQRKCIGNQSDEALFNCISTRHSTIGSHHYEGDSDLESTLGFIDRIFGFGIDKAIDFHFPSFTVPHHAWLGHILLYRAWDVLERRNPLPEDIREFVLRSLRLEPLPPAPIVTDCLFIIGLLLGIKVHVSDLLVMDKSEKKGHQIDEIYKKLDNTFKNSCSSPGEIDSALEAMKLIAPFSGEEIASKSYELFHIIMQVPAPFTDSEEKWQAARLTMHGAYKWDEWMPYVGDPQHILDFLNHHFELAVMNGQNQDEPIRNALRALAYAPSPDTLDALNKFDPTDPSFIGGISYVFQGDRPFELRKAALFFLSRIGDKWFNAPDPIMNPDQINAFCEDWSSAAGNIEHTHHVQNAILTVLLGMINSQHWRPHIVSKNWNLLQYIAAVPDDSQPLKRCLDNSELIDAISEVENPHARVLWLEILWLNYKKLIPEIREQLKKVTREVAQSEGPDFNACLSAVESEWGKADDALMRYDALSTDPVAIAQRMKVDSLVEARRTLLALRRR